MPMEMLAQRAAEHPDKIYLRQPRNGEYHPFTWSQVYQQARCMATGLVSLGLERGDRVVIFSENCAEWFIADFAIQIAGLISVPIYSTASEPTIRYIVEHAEAKAVVVGKLADFSAVQKALDDDVISIAMPYETMQCNLQMQELIDQSEPMAAPLLPELEDTFSISYTSGSTGTPKGVVLSYKNIMASVISAINMLDDTVEARVLSYLPLAHITERALIQYSSLYADAEVTFNESLDTFLDDLKSARATFFLSVPRLWIKFQSGVLAKLPQKKLDRLLRIPLLRNRVKRKIREQLGLQYVRSFGCGSAPVPKAILQWYQKLGINISEGWGMTECSGMGTTQFPFRAEKLGTIGPPIEGVEVKISEEGELLVRGDVVFTEYYKDPDLSRQSFDAEGYLKTGDRAEIDSDGHLTIVGRIKEQFKTGKGKYVAPVAIEGLLGVNQLIEQSCVMGAGLPQPIALVVLSAEMAESLDQSSIAQSLMQTMKQCNEVLEPHQRLDAIRIVGDAWTVENGLLTPTLKIKRAELERKYQEVLAKGDFDAVSWDPSPV